MKTNPRNVRTKSFLSRATLPCNTRSSAVRSDLIPRYLGSRTLVTLQIDLPVNGIMTIWGNVRRVKLSTASFPSINDFLQNASALPVCPIQSWESGLTLGPVLSCQRNSVRLLHPLHPKTTVTTPGDGSCGYSFSRVLFFTS